MKERYKKYLKINIIPIIFLTTSFIFTTFAWFAYSGLKHVSTEIDVKAWYIELTKSGDTVSNDIVITLNDIYPGMETIDEIVNIQNKGDSDAKLNYEIISARILDTELSNVENLEDTLSHEYPFHLNIDLGKKYISSEGDSSTFEVSVSWPLDSGNDNLDSTWGMNAYEFQKNEETLHLEDPSYEIRPAVQIIISLEAEQYLDDNEASDMRYNLGDNILYDVVSNRRCFTLSTTCINTVIIDENNKKQDQNVKLLPTLYEEYYTSTFDNYENILLEYTKNWTAPTRALSVEDILTPVSKDVINTLMNGENISPQIVGNIKYPGRINIELAKAITLNGYYTFLNERFSFLAHSGCFWTNTGYNNENAFAFGKLNELKTQIYPNLKTSECQVVPVIIAPKSNL